MEKQKNHEYDYEFIDLFQVIVAVDGFTYFRCQYCWEPLKSKFRYIYMIDKDDHVYNLQFVHYKCREPFETKYRGHWYSIGLGPVKISWEE